MGVAGADEVPADVGPAPQRVNAFHAGQGLVGGVEICREQQAPAFGERPVGAVMPKWRSRTAVERVGSIRNTTVSPAMNTHSHHRWPSLPSTCSNTRQLVSSACTCTASALRAPIASSSGTSRSATAFSAPLMVPSATSRPSAASARAIRCTGRPSTNFWYSSRARNPAVNRPLGTGFGAGGAITVRGPGHWQRRRYRSLRCTIRVTRTCQSICSPHSDPRNANSTPHSGQTR